MKKFIFPTFLVILNIFQNVLALACLAVAAPIPGRPVGEHSVREIRSKHLFIGNIISKLQALLDKDQNYYKVNPTTSLQEGSTLNLSLTD